MVRPVLGEETYSFGNCLDASSVLRYDMVRVAYEKIQLTVLTDVQSTFSMIATCSITTRKRHKMNARKHQKDDLGCIRTSENLADGLDSEKTFEISWKLQHREPTRRKVENRTSKNRWHSTKAPFNHSVHSRMLTGAMLKYGKKYGWRTEINDKLQTGRTNRRTVEGQRWTTIKISLDT